MGTELMSLDGQDLSRKGSWNGGGGGNVLRQRRPDSIEIRVMKPSTQWAGKISAFVYGESVWNCALCLLSIRADFSWAVSPCV